MQVLQVSRSGCSLFRSFFSPTIGNLLQFPSHGQLFRHLIQSYPIEERVSMTIKNYATLVLVIGVGLVSGIVVHAYGGISQLFNTETLLALFGINLPFFMLWAVAISAKGTAAPRWAIAISIAFILLDARFTKNRNFRAIRFLPKINRTTKCLKFFNPLA